MPREQDQMCFRRRRTIEIPDRVAATIVNQLRARHVPKDSARYPLIWPECLPSSIPLCLSCPSPADVAQHLPFTQAYWWLVAKYQQATDELGDPELCRLWSVALVTKSCERPALFL